MLQFCYNSSDRQRDILLLDNFTQTLFFCVTSIIFLMIFFHLLFVYVCVFYYLSCKTVYFITFCVWLFVSLSSVYVCVFTYLLRMFRCTEAGVNGPTSPVFSSQLHIPGWIHLYQQSCPTQLLLQPNTVRTSLSIQSSSLNKETIHLKNI